MEIGSTPSTATSTPSTPPSQSSKPQQSSSAPAQASSPQSAPIKEATPPNAHPTQESIKEYKIDGKIVKMTQKEADDYISMSYVAQQRLHEAGRMRKELEAREQNYQKDPLKAYLDYAKKAGHSTEQIRQNLEDYYSKEWIEPETLSKEELALRQREAKVKQWEKEQEQRQIEEHETQQKKMTQDQINNITAEIVSALEGSPIPVTDKTRKYLVQRMAFYMNENNKNQYNAPKEIILKQVVKEHQGLVGDFLIDAPVDKIVNYLGEKGQDFIDRVLKYSLEKLRESRNKLQEPFVKDQDNADMNETSKMDYREVNRRLRNLRTGKYIG